MSVIVPVYNAEKYLHSCVSSILAQTRLPDEIVLVNDGSTDGSGALCNALAAKHTQIVVAHTPNRGAAAARHNGFQLSTGALVGFVDGDDILHPAMYQRLAAMLRQTGASIACCGYRLVAQPPQIANIAEAQTDDVQICVLEGSERFVALTRDPKVQPSLANKLYRRFLFDEPLNWQEDMRHYEDLALNYTLFARAPAVARCSADYYFYRLHEASASHNWNGEKLVEDRMAATEVFAALAAEDPSLKNAVTSTTNEALLYLYTQLARRSAKRQ